MPERWKELFVFNAPVEAQLCLDTDKIDLNFELPMVDQELRIASNFLKSGHFMPFSWTNPFQHSGVFFGCFFLAETSQTRFFGEK